VLNAWFFAGIAGVGLPLFQQMIARPGLPTGLYMNTRRIGSILSGPIIAIGSLTNPRATRDLRHQCSPHPDRRGDHRDRQPNEQASP
jgi:hypothetical protein